MAKHKNTARLFEVMQANRAKRKGFSMSVPTWWFKRQLGSTGHPAAAHDSAPVATLPTEQDAAHAPPAPRISGVDLKIDRDRQLVHFKATYTNVILSAFAIIVIVSLAYVFGKSVHTSPTPAYAGDTIEQLKKKPASAKVLDIGTVKPGKVTDDTSAAAPGTPVKPTNPKAPVTPVATGTVTAQSFNDTDRVVGRNYVIVQIYPSEASAHEVEALLVKNGIPATVVNGLANYANRSWWCVVTETGFDRISGNPEYDAFLKKIKAVGDQFISSSKFKKFQPLPYKWRGS